MISATSPAARHHPCDPPTRAEAGTRQPRSAHSSAAYGAMTAAGSRRDTVPSQQQLLPKTPATGGIRGQKAVRTACSPDCAWQQQQQQQQLLVFDAPGAASDAAAGGPRRLGPPQVRWAAAGHRAGQAGEGCTGQQASPCAAAAAQGAGRLPPAARAAPCPLQRTPLPVAKTAGAGRVVGQLAPGAQGCCARGGGKGVHRRRRSQAGACPPRCGQQHATTLPGCEQQAAAPSPFAVNLPDRPTCAACVWLRQRRSSQRRTRQARDCWWVSGRPGP